MGIDYLVGGSRADVMQIKKDFRLECGLSTVQVCDAMMYIYKSNKIWSGGFRESIFASVG